MQECCKLLRKLHCPFARKPAPRLAFDIVNYPNDVQLSPFLLGQSTDFRGAEHEEDPAFICRHCEPSNGSDNRGSDNDSFETRD
jgi:hypothetical protein